MAKIPINISSGTLQKEEIVVGIDLGTTNSLIAFINPETGKPAILKEFDATSLVPSILYFDPSGEIKVGEAARNYIQKAPERTIFSAKRLMGKNYGDVIKDKHFFAYNIVAEDMNAPVSIQIDNTFYTPVTLASLLLKALKERAEHILKTPVNAAVITVPAYFNDMQRQATRDAGRLAGLNVLRVINEPTAASLAYGIGRDLSKEQIVAVYDLGGGTFDISILRIVEGIFEVLATNGDTYLGGDDIDKAILSFWQAEYAFDSVRHLRPLAEKAKKELSEKEIFTHYTEGKDITLTLSKLNELTQPLIERTLSCAARALKDAGLTIKDIEKVLLVGGATRMPAIEAAVADYFQCVPDKSLNPDEVVALGAAVQADILSGANKDMLLLDVTPLSLGIETMGGLMDVLIPRNAKIPTRAERTYTTQKDGQSGIAITVYQGERDLVEHNRMLGSFILKGIPPMPAGLPKIIISFWIDADGILSVKAQEERSGISQEITLTPRHGLTEDKITDMLQSSLTHAQTDMQMRALIETETEASRLITTTEQFLNKNQSFLNAAEIAATQATLSELKDALNTKDKNILQSAMEAVHKITESYAESVMSAAFKEALNNRKEKE